MVSLPLAYGDYKRTVGGFPELIARNVIAEQAPTQQEKQLAILARPGKVDLGIVGQGPIRGIARKSGLFASDAILLSGSEVYRLEGNGSSTVLTGSIPGLGRVRIDIGRDADDVDEARIATGDALYLVKNGEVTLEDFPEAGGAGASDIVFHRGFWIATEAGTDKVYYRPPGATTWDALDFASAEYQPDKTLAAESLRDQIWLLADTTAEGWTLTGDTNNPIQPYGGLNFDIGCRARDAATVVGAALIWVDDRCNVQMTTGGEPRVISNNSVAEQIRLTEAEDLRAWGFELDGHTYYVLSLTDATLVYDFSTQIWTRWSSKGLDYFRGHLGCELAGQILATDAQQGSGQIWQLSPEAKDDDGEEFTVGFMAYRELSEGVEDCRNLELICLGGDAPREGQGSEPFIRMRYSDDGGKTWANWRFASLGATGDYSIRCRWRQLGQIKAPYGRIFEFSASDPVGRRFSDLRMNSF